MPETFCLEEQAQATHAYVQALLASLARRHTPDALRAPDVDKLRALREEVRISEGGGGMCHVMMEILWKEKGWEGLSVSYLDPQGLVICAGHCINFLPDGSILDSTADQFGEGHDVRILRPQDPEYGRYRPEFYQDFDPVQSEEARAFFWNGVWDCEAQDQMVSQRGRGWWLADKSLYAAYLRHQVKLGCRDYVAWLEQLSA